MASPTQACARQIFQAVRDLLLRNRAFLDHAPVELGDIHGAGADALAGTAVKHKIDAAIHHTEHLDAASACRAGRKYWRWWR